MIDIKVKLDSGAIMPRKAYESDAGFDLFTPVRIALFPGSAKTIDTGVHMLIPKGYWGNIKTKSGLNVKDGIITEGVVDADYTGSIRVKLRQIQEPESIIKVFEPGDKIAQIVIEKVPEVRLVEVDELPETARGNNGFGSTGR